MGYDIYGMNPKVNKVYPDRYNEIMNKYGDKDGWLDWSKEIPEDVKEEYFELKDNYETDNPGSYFRNNVWWWRPLWDYVCNICEDFMTHDEMNAGCSNSGFEISEEVALKISKRLSEEIGNGNVDKVALEHETKRLQEKAHNKEVRKELDKITEACQKEHGKDVVPANYPEPYYTQWNECYAKEIFSANYPFSKENVENFATFCQQSGGFEIC